MPNRLLKESICYSAQIDELTSFEETVFYRLIVNVDDYGRIDGRSTFLRSKLFVTKQGITAKNVQDAVNRLATIGLVELYEVDGDVFLWLPKWHEHQRIRDSKARYPAPPDRSRNEEKDSSPQVAASCRKLPQSAARAGAESESNPIQSESNPNPYPDARGGARDDADVSTSEESDVQGVFDVYMQEIDPLPSLRVQQHIEDYLAVMDPAVLIEAFERARDAGARKWNYVNGILKNWKNAGIKTMAAVESEDIKHAYRKNTKNNKGASNFSERADRSKYADVENKRVIRLMGETEVNA